MPIDPNVFQNIKNFPDYQRADQAFQLQKALQAQQLQTSGIDAQTKINAYKTQLLAGAVAGGQPAYDQARQTLQQQGIDTSEFAPDVQTATTQVNAARLAQAPAYQLLNTALKADSNNIQRAGVNGDVAPQFNPAAVIGGTTAPQPTAAPAPANNVATPSGYVDNQTVKYPTVSAATNAVFPDANAATQPALVPTPPIGAGPANQPPTVAQATAPFNAAPKFVEPPDDPTKNRATNDAIKSRALEQFKINNAAAIEQDKAAATETGKNDAAHAEGALGSKDILRLYNKLGTEAPSVPSGALANMGASISNAAGMPTQGAINRGAYDADLNNLYLATIRSLKGTGRIQLAELQKIEEAAPKDTDSTAVKISKSNAHIEDYNQRMRDVGFNPSTGKPITADSPAVDIPQVPNPGSSAPTNGTIADNPKTGESLVYMNGAWKPLKGAK